MKRVLVLIGIWSLLTSCGQDPLNEAALKEALSRARPAHALKHGGGARQVPFSILPMHRATIVFRFTIGTGTQERERVSFRRTIARASGGKFALAETRTWSNPTLAKKGTDDGRSAIYDGKRFLSKRRWGPWKERAHWRGEQRGFLADAYDVFPTVLKAFAPYISWSDGEKDKVLGLNAQQKIATLNTTPKLPEKSIEEIRALRQREDGFAAWMALTHRPEEITGELWQLDSDPQAHIGKLAIRGNAEYEGQRLPFEVEIEVSVKRLKDTKAFKMPRRVLPEGRTRVWSMVRDVLGKSLNPVYNRAATRAKK